MDRMSATGHADEGSLVLVPVQTGVTSEPSIIEGLRPPGPVVIGIERKGASMAKSSCPVRRAEFLELAQPVELKINEIPMHAEVKEFSTGSLGWYLNSKVNLKVGEKIVTVQVGVNLTVVGSKELPKRDETVEP